MIVDFYEMETIINLCSYLQWENEILPFVAFLIVASEYTLLSIIPIVWRGHGRLVTATIARVC